MAPNRPPVEAGYVAPSLAGWAHLIVSASTSPDGRRTGSVFLGPQRAAGKSKLAALRASSPPVAAVANCTPSFPNHHENEGIAYCRVAVNDECGANVLPYLDGAADFVRRHVERGDAVLVHCQMGASRSATVVVAYLMKYHAMTRDQAYAFVKRRRPTAEPNAGFWEQLQVYERRLRKAEGADASLALDAKFDEGWTESSLARFHLVGHILDSSQLFPEIAADSDMASALSAATDHVFGRGLLAADLDWLSALCDSCKRHGGDPTHMLDDIFSEGSNFMDMWSGEVYPGQIEKVKAAIASREDQT